MEFEVPFTLHSLHPAAFGPIYVRRAFHFPLLLYVGRFYFFVCAYHHTTVIKSTLKQMQVNLGVLFPPLFLSLVLYFHSLHGMFKSFADSDAKETHL